MKREPAPPSTEPIVGPRARHWLDGLRAWRLASLLFSDEGRVGRRAFWLYFAAVMALAAAIFFTRGLRQWPMAHAAFGVLLLFPSYCIFAKRLQDFDAPKAWAIAIVAVSALDLLLAASGLKSRPGRLSGVMSLWEWVGVATMAATLLVLGAWPGTQGVNRYGARTPPW